MVGLWSWQWDANIDVLAADTTELGKAGIWVECSPNGFCPCTVRQWHQVSTPSAIANSVNLVPAKVLATLLNSRSEVTSVKIEKYNKYHFFATLSICCVPPQFSAKRIPGHKSIPNSQYLLFKLNREAAFATLTEIQWPHTKIQRHSRISSSHTIPETLTQHSQPPAGTGTLPSPMNFQTPHLPPAQAVTPSQWQTGKDLP